MGFIPDLTYLPTGHRPQPTFVVQPNMAMPNYPDPVDHQRYSQMPYHQLQLGNDSTMTQPHPPHLQVPQHGRAPAPIAETQHTSTLVDNTSFIRFRDNHANGLYQVEWSIGQIRHRFLADTDTLIRGGQITTQDVTNLQNGYGHFANQVLHAPPAPPNAVPGPNPLPAKPEKKPKRPHDKNAPTKAMTPFFLYMQTERPKIQKELGPQYKPKEVEAIGQQRWKEISDKEKQDVKYQYFCNRAGYYKQNELYKAGLPFPEYTQAEKEKFYAEELEKEHASKIRGPGGAPNPAPQSVAARAKSHEPATESENTSNDDSEGASESESDATPAPARKEPTPPPAKKRKTAPAEVASTPATATKFPPKLKSFSQPEVVEESAVRQKKKKEKREAAAGMAPPAVVESSPVPIAIPSSHGTGEKKKKRKLRKSGLPEE